MRMFKSLATGIITITLFAVIAMINVSAAEVTIQPSGDKTGEKDYFALQDALSLAKNASENEPTTIKLEAGNYYIKYGLRIQNGGSNITIKGPKTAVVTQVSSGTGILGNDAVAGKYDSNSNITVDGCTWIAKYDKCDGFSVMLFSHANGVTIKNAVFKNVYKGHLVELAGVKNALITNCDFGGTYAGPEGDADEAVQLDITHGPDICGYLGVDKNDKAMQAIVFDDTPCDNVVIENNVINFSRGIGSHFAVGNRPHTNVSIYNNKITATEKGILLNNYYNTKVYNNTITSGDSGITAKAESSSISGNTNNTNGLTNANNRAIQIYNNTLNNCKGSGIRVVGTAVFPIDYTVVENNTINATGDSGIVVSYASYCTVKNNKLNNIGTLSNTTVVPSALAQLNGTRNVVINNTVKTSRDIGIRAVNASYSTVKNNNLSKIGGYGISISESSNNSTVEYNVINKASIGIRAVAGSYSTVIQNNTLSNLSERGIAVSQSASVKVTLNKITSTGGHGIHFLTNSTSGEITSNTIKNTKVNGIQVTDIGSMVKVESNTISSAGGTGIGFANVYTPYVNNNIIATAKGNGISANKSRTVTITNNTMSDVKTNGIFVLSAQTATVTSNAVKNSTNNGLRFLDCKMANVSLNKIHTSGDNGISAYNSKIVIQNNTFEKSSDNGMFIFNCPKSTVVDNVTTNNKLRGIRITSKSHSIYVANNKISNNKGDGIMIDGSNNATITKNTISGNCKRYGLCLLSGKGLRIKSNAISGSFVSPITIAKKVKSCNIKKMGSLKVDKVQTKSKKPKKMKIIGTCDENTTVSITFDKKTYKTKKQKGSKTSFASTKKIKLKPKNILKVIQTDKGKNTYTKTVKVVK